MSLQENKSNDNKTGVEIVSKKSGTAKTVITVIVLIAAIFLVKNYVLKGGDAPQQPQAQAQQAPHVVVTPVEKADLAIGREYIGRVEPIQTVSLRPQTDGELLNVHFKDGAFVRAGQVLFTIDSRQHQANVELSKAELMRAEANYDRARKYYERLKSSDERSVSAADLERAESDTAQCRAVIEQAKASLKLAQIHLGYTTIKAPISGKISKALFTKGNYISPASGTLATIVQTDSVRVTFSLPDRDYLKQLEAFKSTSGAVYDTSIRLADGSEYPLKGERDFEDNRMNEQTGTIQISLRFKNSEGKLTPGSVVRVITKPTQSNIALVIPKEAVMTDNELDYVYTVGSDNIPAKKRITLGVSAGAKYEVTEGLSEGEHVVVYGLQHIRPQLPVQPELMSDGGEKSAPERAKESMFDVKAISGDSASADKSPTEGK